MKNAFLFVCILFSLKSFSQKTQLSGQLVNSSDSAPLVGATINLMDQDNELFTQVISDLDGKFFIDGVDPGDYQIQISFLGYFSIYKDLSISADIDLGLMPMVAAPIGMDEIVVEGKAPPAIQKGDTTSFNASQYKVLNDASTEDLITKMPGVVLENGQVQAQGETVQEVLVDGKPFFGNDPSAALKNLPAEVVERIEIFDQKSEQAEFTGFDDGQTTKTINIVTKVDRRTGQFGKGYGALGTEGHYNAGGNFSIMNGDQRISFIGQSNNINIQNFASEDLLGISGSSGRRGGRGGGSSWGRGNSFIVPQQNGIATTHALGINFSDQWGENTEITASYFVNQSDNLSLETLNRQFFDREGNVSSQVYNENNEGNTLGFNHRFNARFEHKFSKNTSISLRPRISYQGSNVVNSMNGITLSDGTELNNSTNDYGALSRGLNFYNSTFLRHRFGESKRTISLQVRNQINNQNGETELQALNRYFAPVLQDETLDQISDFAQNGSEHSASLSYTEPIGKNSMLSAEYRFEMEQDNADQKTFDVNENGFYEDLNEMLSNVLESDYTTHRGGIAYNYRKGKSMIMARAAVQYSTLNTDQSFPYENMTSRNFLNFVPFAMWRYNIDRQNNLRLIYRTYTRRPTVSQLQEVLNNSNPLQLTIGNENLDQQLQHGIFARLQRTNTEKGTVLYALIGGNITQDYIGSSLYTSRSDAEFVEEFDLERGTQLTRTVNLDGYWDFRTFLTYGFPIEFIKSNLNLNLTANFSNTPGLIDEALNETFSGRYGLGLTISSNISERIDFSVSSNSSYNDINNTINSAQNSQFYIQQTGVKMNWILPADLVFRTDFSNQFYTGLAEGFNENFWIWNLAIGKKIFKNKLGEINISVYDLLNQNLRINTEITGNYIENSNTNVLQRYVMLNFIYNFRNYKTSKKSSEPSRDENRSWDPSRRF